MMFDEKIRVKKYVLFILVFVLNCTRVSGLTEPDCSYWNKVMPSNEPRCSDWKMAEQPNYSTNRDLGCQFSDSPFQPERYSCSVDHDNKPPCISATSVKSDEILDFWGEGRIDDNGIITGFKDSFNANHQFKVVSNGPDRPSKRLRYGRKIPNRIPTRGFNPNISLAKYIEDDTCTIITMMGGPIGEKETTDEILRIIKKDASSAVIVYGYDTYSDKDRELWETQLKEKYFSQNTNYFFSEKLLEPFQRPTAFTYTKVGSDATKHMETSKNPRQDLLTYLRNRKTDKSKDTDTELLKEINNMNKEKKFWTTYWCGSVVEITEMTDEIAQKALEILNEDL